MSKDLIRALEMGAVPWLRLDRGVVDEPSKKAVDETFLRLGGRVFFPFVEPMKSRSKAPRRGWSEFVSELVSVAQKAHGLAEIWHEGGGRSVELVSKAIRKIPGFGGKGFRMKAAVLCNAQALSPNRLLWGREGGPVGPARKSCLTWPRRRKTDTRQYKSSCSISELWDLGRDVL